MPGGPAGPAGPGRPWKTKVLNAVVMKAINNTTYWFSSLPWITRFSSPSLFSLLLRNYQEITSPIQGIHKTIVLLLHLGQELQWNLLDREHPRQHHCDFVQHSPTSNIMRYLSTVVTSIPRCSWWTSRALLSLFSWQSCST